VLLWQRSNHGKCVDYDEESDFIEPLRGLDDQNRSWWWQMCTEFGYFTVTNIIIKGNGYSRLMEVYFGQKL
jgi:hypothetical protein